MTRLLKRLSPIAALASLAGLQSCQAQMIAYDATFTSSFFQDSDAQPTTELGEYFIASMYTTNDFEVIDGRVYKPDSTLLQLGFSSPRYWIFYSEPFTNISDLVANYPSGDYLFEVASGNLAPASATLFVPEADYPNEIPYLTGGTWSALQNTPADVDSGVMWNPSTHNGTSTDQYSQLILFDYATTMAIFNNSGPTSTYTSDVLPGSILKSGHTIGYSLYYYNHFPLENQGFGGAYSDVAYYRATNGQFHVKANPGTISGQIVLEDYYYPVGKYVTVEVVGSGGVEDTQSVLVGIDGWYAFDTASTGVKTITFKGVKWLKKAVVDVDLGVGQDSINVSLVNGDCDDDNEVTLADYSILATAFGSVPEDSNWDERADLNGDAEVNLADYAILAANFGVADDD